MKNRKLLRAAAALLLVGVVGVASVGCSFELEQPEWVTQALCDHVFDEEEVLKEATCTEDGKIQKTCSDCGKTKITTVKGEHDYCDPYESAKFCLTDEIEYESECLRCGNIVCTTSEVIDVPHFDADGDGNCDYCRSDLVEALYGAERLFPNFSSDISAEGWYEYYIEQDLIFTIDSISCAITDTSDFSGTLDFDCTIEPTENSFAILSINLDSKNQPLFLMTLFGDFIFQDGLAFGAVTDGISVGEIVLNNDYGNPCFFYLPETIEFSYGIGPVPGYYEDIMAEGIMTVTLDCFVGANFSHIRVD